MNRKIQEQLKDYYAVWLGLDRLYQEWGKQYGLTYHSLFVLYAIRLADGNCSQKHICEEWMLPKQTVNAILRNFQKEGYTRFVQDESDRRNKWIILTEKGNAFADEVIGGMTRMEASVLEEMGAEKGRQMTELNRMFYSLLEHAVRREVEA